MNISSPPRLRRMTFAVLFMLVLGLGIIFPIVLGHKGEYDGMDIFGIAFGAFLALISPLVFLRAKRIDVDEEGITIVWVLTRRRLRYLHSEMTGVDYRLNVPVKTTSMTRYIHVIEFIPTGEPIFRVTTDTNGNFDALLAQARRIYGEKARDMSKNQPGGF